MAQDAIRNFPFKEPVNQKTLFVFIFNIWFICHLLSLNKSQI